MTTKKALESERFDALLGKVLSVSREELERREAEWKKRRKARKRTKVKAS